jgi:hypothetical protein
MALTQIGGGAHHPPGLRSCPGRIGLWVSQRFTKPHGSVVTSDAGLLAYRELDDALGLSTMAGEVLADARAGKNERHALVGLLRQSVFGRLAGYEDVNDAERPTPSRQRAQCRRLGECA